MNSLLFFLLCLINFSINIENSDGYRILAIFPFNSRSHNNVFEGVTRGLAKRGHQVDAVTHFEMKNSPKNYQTIINLSGTRRNIVNNFTIDFATQLGDDLVPLISVFYGNELCELLAHKDIQRLVKNPPTNPPYDILITEVCLFSKKNFSIR